MSNDDMSQATDAPSQRFGQPRRKREETLKQLQVDSSTPTENLMFQGVEHSFPSIRIPIGLPKYRLANGRTASLQEEFLATEGKLRDYFTRDPELLEVQEVQHGFLKDLAEQAELRKHFENPENKQQQRLILDAHGFVVNGNRRLACWRELAHRQPDKYRHFSHINVVVLPPCDEKDIDKLEADLQIVPDIKADYSWDARANMIKSKMESFSPDEIASMYKMKPNEINELLDMRDYATEYLESRGKKSKWSEVSGDEFAFRQLVKQRKSVDGVQNKDDFKNIVFSLIDSPRDAPGRAYAVISEIKKHLPQIKEKAKNEMAAEPSRKQTNTGQDFDMLGDGGDLPDDESELSQALSDPENSDIVRGILVDVVEGARRRRQDESSKNYLIDRCADAQKALMEAVSHGLHAETNRDGVDKQISGIEKHIGRIKEFLD